MINRTFFPVLLAVSLAACNAEPTTASPGEGDVYQVDFETSCSAKVRQPFDHALTLLHSFEYTETTRLFAHTRVCRAHETGLRRQSR